LIDYLKDPLPIVEVISQEGSKGAKEILYLLELIKKETYPEMYETKK
jgi:hypothetical protein